MWERLNELSMRYFQLSRTVPSRIGNLLINFYSSLRMLLPIEDECVIVLPFRVYVGTCRMFSGSSSIIVKTVPVLSITFFPRFRYWRRERWENGIVTVMFPEDLARNVLVLTCTCVPPLPCIGRDMVYLLQTSDPVPVLVQILELAVKYLEELVPTLQVLM